MGSPMAWAAVMCSGRHTLSADVSKGMERAAEYGCSGGLQYSRVNQSNAVLFLALAWGAAGGHQQGMCPAARHTQAPGLQALHGHCFGCAVARFWRSRQLKAVPRRKQHGTLQVGVGWKEVVKSLDQCEMRVSYKMDQSNEGKHQCACLCGWTGIIAKLCVSAQLSRACTPTRTHALRTHTPNATGAGRSRAR
jgi:hypothetical protein